MNVMMRIGIISTHAEILQRGTENVRTVGMMITEEKAMVHTQKNHPQGGEEMMKMTIEDRILIVISPGTTKIQETKDIHKETTSGMLSSSRGVTHKTNRGRHGEFDTRENRPYFDGGAGRGRGGRYPTNVGGAPPPPFRPRRQRCRDYDGMQTRYAAAYNIQLFRARVLCTGRPMHFRSRK